MKTIRILADHNGYPILRPPIEGERYIRVWGSETPGTNDDLAVIHTAGTGSLAIRDQIGCLIVVEDEDAT